MSTSSRGARWAVIGAGSGGCVVASRLSEDPERLVELIDAGPGLSVEDVPERIAGPNFIDAMTEGSRTISVAASGGPYVTGRGIGGSSLINAMVALRGDLQQYSAWGWSDCERAWDRMQIPEERAEATELGPVDRALLASTATADRVPLTRRRGRRVTAAEAYLWPAADRGNLTIRPNCSIDRIRVDGDQLTVIADDGAEVSADHVVLCAGAIASPAILLRSEIGNGGVGQGLQDHPSVSLTLKLRADIEQRFDGLIVATAASFGDIQVLPMNHLGSDAPGLAAIAVALLAPRGVGSVVIDPAHASGKPLVRFAGVDDPIDRRRLRDGVTAVLALLEEPAFASLVEAIFVDDRGTPVGSINSTGALDDWMMASSGVYRHASSTCAMGVVVDDRGRLLGHDNIYVCDASVFPSIPHTNTHLPTTMLAERLVAMW